MQGSFSTALFCFNDVRVTRQVKKEILSLWAGRPYKQ
jgi:hypothetical protein